MGIASSVKSKTVKFVFGCRSIFLSPYRLEIYGVFFFDERFATALDVVTARPISGMMDHRMSVQREKKRRKKKKETRAEFKGTGCRPVSLLRCAAWHRTADRA
jgi:hypothetical protein